MHITLTKKFLFKARRSVAAKKNRGKESLCLVHKKWFIKNQTKPEIAVPTVISSSTLTRCTYKPRWEVKTSSR